jgi:TonB-dependent receptor
MKLTSPHSSFPPSQLRAILLLAGFFLLLLQASAGSIAGRVREAGADSYLFGAHVRIRELGRTANTSSDGVYFFANVPAGAYTLVTSYTGYRDASQLVEVVGDAEARADFSLGTEVLKLEKFVVSGELEGQARALQQKRYADNVMDVVSADSAGKLPDGNAAEAVRRLPGVFAEIDQNEGRYIVVRGIDANLNNITINGISVGSTEALSRGAAMDSVPADLISRIEVVKAVTPDMDAQAIGASVNIVTPSAFDREKGYASGTLAGGYFNGPRGDFFENKKTPYSGSAVYSTTFGGGKWGFIVGGSYSYRHYISNRRSGGGTWYPAAASGPGADIFFPATEALFHYDVQRWRAGANAALEFRPSDNHHYTLRLTENRFKDQEGREQNGFDFFQTAFPASYTDTSAHFTGGRSTVEYRYYHQRHNITNVSFEGKDTLGDGATKLDYTVAVGSADKIVPNRIDWEFRSGSSITSDIDTSAHYWVVTPEAKFFDAATFPFRRVRFRKDDETEDNLTAELNLKRDRQILGHQGFWQVGGKFFSRDKTDERENTDYLAGTGANLFNLGQFNLSTAGHEMFDGDFRMSPQINFRAIEDFFKANPNYFVPNPAGTLSDSYVTDFQMKEKISSAYAMAKADFGLWSVLAGVRVERSDADITQTELATIGGVTAPRLKPFSTDYTNVLPGIHLKFTPQKNWVLRAAWTNTIGRPNYPDMAAASVASFTPDVAGGNVYTIAISEGNPGLKPYESMNFDLTSEYYFKNAGLFSVSAFHKEIDNPIFTNSYTLRNGTYEGLSYSQLSYTKPQNADSGKISGVEFNYQLQLKMLPSPFDGFGFSVNYTAARSEEHLFGARAAEELEFLKQAPRLYNVALFYEKYRFQARVAYTYTGAFRKSYGGTADSDAFQDERKIVDAKVSYRLSKNLTLFADVINLGQEPLDEYSRYPERNGATERYWWTTNFGVNWRL